LSANGAQYLLPAGLRPEAAKEALAVRLGLEPDGRRTRVERTFYDTFDGRLHAAGIALVQSDGQLVAMGMDAYGERASVPWPVAAPRLFAHELPAGRLRDLVEPLVDVRALTPIAHTSSHLLALRMLNGSDKTVARLVVESPTANGPTGTRTRLRSRVHVLPVRGYEKAADRLRRQLEADIGLIPATSPLHDEAVAIAGGTPGGVPAKLELALRPEQRADEAAAVVLRRLLGAIEDNIPGTLADVDSEFLHDLRVAVRRTRALQRELRGVFPPLELQRFREGFRWLQAVTGPTRDLDVYLLDFEGFRGALPGSAGNDLHALYGLLADERKLTQRRMARALRSDKARQLLSDWSAFIEDFASEPEDERPDAGRPIGELAGARIATVYKRMVKGGRKVEDDGPAEALHDLRKQGKELRYLLEFFGALYPAKTVRPMLKTLKALQDILGRFQDTEVQATMLRDHRDAVAAREGGAAALMAMGLLVDRLESDKAAARLRFAERFAAFSSARQRALVEDAFG
jgi:CHAD domain-containing protein